jgi:hypothetical protein
MGILVVAGKVEETARHATYEFGLDEQFDRRIRIEKESGEVTTADGNLDVAAGMISVKIKRFLRETGKFPQVAVYAA